MTDRPITELCPQCLGEGLDFIGDDWIECGVCGGTGDRVEEGKNDG